MQSAMFIRCTYISLVFWIVAVTGLLSVRAQDAGAFSDEISSLFQRLERSVAENEAARAESEAREILALLLERMAMIYELTGDTDLQHRSLKEAIRASVVSDRAMVRLVEFYLEKGRYEEGIATVRDLLTINALHVHGQLLLGKLQILSGNPEAAIHPLRDAYESSGRNSEIGLVLAYAYLETGDLASADRLIEEMLAQQGPTIQLLTRSGRVYLETGHFAKAVERFETAAARAPGDSAIQNLLESARRETGVLATALSDTSILMEGLRRRSPDDQRGQAEAQLSSLRQNVAGVYRILGQAQMQQNAFSSAVQSLTLALFWNPDLEGAELLKATALLRGGSIGEAAELLRNRLERDSSDHQAITLLTRVAGAQAQAGELRSAADHVDYLLTLVPDSAVLLVLRGRIAAESGDLDAALSDFQEALSRDPNLPEANYNAGTIFWKKDSVDRALDYFEAELRVNPRHGHAAFRKASILFSRGEKRAASDILEQLISRRPAFADPYILLARIQASEGDPTRAIANLEVAAQFEPNRADIYRLLSEAYEKTGREAEAREALGHYDRLMSRTP